MVVSRGRLRLPAYRLAGLLAALATVRSIYFHRRELREVRESDDSEFLTLASET